MSVWYRPRTALSGGVSRRRVSQAHNAFILLQNIFQRVDRALAVVFEYTSFFFLYIVNRYTNPTLSFFSLNSADIHLVWTRLPGLGAVTHTRFFGTM